MATQIIGTKDAPVWGVYDLRAAELSISCAGKPIFVLDETECDRLLRVCDYVSRDDAELDLAEFFEHHHGDKAGRVGSWFYDHADVLGECVYETT